MFITQTHTRQNIQNKLLIHEITTFQHSLKFIVNYALLHSLKMHSEPRWNVHTTVQLPAAVLWLEKTAGWEDASWGIAALPESLTHWRSAGDDDRSVESLTSSSFDAAVSSIACSVCEWTVAPATLDKTPLSLTSSATTTPFSSATVSAIIWTANNKHMPTLLLTIHRPTVPQIQLADIACHKNDL